MVFTCEAGRPGNRDVSKCEHRALSEPIWIGWSERTCFHPKTLSPLSHQSPITLNSKFLIRIVWQKRTPWAKQILNLFFVIFIHICSFDDQIQSSPRPRLLILRISGLQRSKAALSCSEVHGTAGEMWFLEFAWSFWWVDLEYKGYSGFNTVNTSSEPACCGVNIGLRSLANWLHLIHYAS